VRTIRARPYSRTPSCRHSSWYGSVQIWPRCSHCSKQPVRPVAHAQVCAHGHAHLLPLAPTHVTRVECAPFPCCSLAVRSSHTRQHHCTDSPHRIVSLTSFAKQQWCTYVAAQLTPALSSNPHCPHPPNCCAAGLPPPPRPPHHGQPRPAAAHAPGCTHAAQHQHCGVGSVSRGGGRGGQLGVVACVRGVGSRRREACGA